MKEVIERCNWLVNKCEDKAITPDVKDDVRYLLEEIGRLQSKNKKIQTILRTRARQDRKRKAKLRKLRLETTNQRLKLEKLNNIIEKIRDYVYKPIDKEWDDILCIIEDGLKGSDKE